MFLPPEHAVGAWPSLFALQGPGARTAPHQHHGLHLVVAREGTITVTVDGAERRCAGVVMPPDVRHAIDARGRAVVLLFLDPEGEWGAALTDVLAGTPRWLGEPTRSALIGGLDPQAGSEAMLRWVQQALLILGVERPLRSPQHPKVRALIRLLADRPLHPAPSLAALAGELQLSESRLRHVFKESLGVPWRTYVRWLRFQRAVGGIAAGKSLTDAAHEAGFYDSAHMTRTFREMYGVVPSQLMP